MSDPDDYFANHKSLRVLRSEVYAVNKRGDDPGDFQLADDQEIAEVRRGENEKYFFL